MLNGCKLFSATPLNPPLCKDFSKLKKFNAEKQRNRETEKHRNREAYKQRSIETEKHLSREAYK